MALAPNQARLLTLTARKSDLEYKLTLLVNQTQRLAQENSEILNERAQAVNDYVSMLSSGSAEDLASALSTGTEAITADFDAQLAELTVAQNRLDLQQKQLETQEKAVSSEMESVQKIVDSSIKNEFNTQGSN